MKHAGPGRDLILSSGFEFVKLQVGCFGMWMDVALLLRVVFWAGAPKCVSATASGYVGGGHDLTLFEKVPIIVRFKLIAKQIAHNICQLTMM